MAGYHYNDKTELQDRRHAAVAELRYLGLTRYEINALTREATTEPHAVRILEEKVKELRTVGRYNNSLQLVKGDKP